MLRSPAARGLVRSWRSQWFSSRTTNDFTPVVADKSEPVAKKMSKATYTPRLQGRVVEVHDRKPHGRTGPVEPSGKSGHFRSELCVVEKQDGRLLEVVSENGRRFKSRRNNVRSVLESIEGCPVPLSATQSEQSCPEKGCGAADDRGAADTATAAATTATAGEDGAKKAGHSSSHQDSLDARTKWVRGVGQKCDALVLKALDLTVARTAWQRARARVCSGDRHRAIDVEDLAAMLFGVHTVRRARASKKQRLGSEPKVMPATKPILTLDDSADAGLSDACNGIRQAAASMLLRTPLYSCFFDEMFGPGFMPVSPATKRRALLLLDPIVMTDAYLFSRKVFHRLLMRHGEGESHDLSSVRRSFQAMSTLRSGMRDTGPDAPPVVSEWDPSKSNKVAHAIAAAAVHSANTRQKQANRSKKLFARHADALKLQRLRIFSACPPHTRRRDAFVIDLFARLGIHEPPQPQTVAQLIELAGLDDENTVLGVRHQVERSNMPVETNKRDEQNLKNFFEHAGLEPLPEGVDLARIAEGETWRHDSNVPPPRRKRGFEDRDKGRRVDLSHMEVLAIDDVTTKDVDDAVSYERDANGNEWVWVHIADVDRWIQPPEQGVQRQLGANNCPAAALNLNARRQWETVYLPHATYPMFPKAVTVDPRILSLGDGFTSDVLSFGMQVGADGGIERYEIMPATVSNVRRTTYDEVEAFLKGTKKGGGGITEAQSVWGSLMNMFASDTAPSTGPRYTDAQAATLVALNEIAQRRSQWRAQQGSSDFNVPAPRVHVRPLSVGDGDGDGDGNDAANTASASENSMVARSKNFEIEVKLERRGSAQELVAETMILANELVATHCANNGIPIPFRTQNAPLIDEATAKRIDKLPKDPEFVRKLLLVRSAHPASVTSAPARHHSLGLNAYSRATSPIRRYWDLIVHHQVKAHLRGEVLPYTAQAIEKMIPSLLLREVHVKALCAHCDRVWLIEFLRLRQIELQAKNEFVEYDATVTSDMEDVNEVLPGLWKYGALIPGLGLVTQVPAQSKKDVPEPGEAIRLRLENAQPVRRMLRWNRVRQA